MNTTNSQNRTPRAINIKEMETQIMKLRNEVNSLKEDKNDALESQVRMAEAHFELVKKRVEEFGKKTGQAKAEIKKGVEEAWRDLFVAVERAKRYMH